MENSKSEDPPESLLDRISARQDLRQNKMYSSLTRPSTARARQARDRRGSYDGSVLGDDLPGSPRDTASLRGNLRVENNQGKGERRQYRQAVNPEVHGAIDHFIRSEQRLVHASCHGFYFSPCHHLKCNAAADGLGPKNSNYL